MKNMFFLTILCLCFSYCKNESVSKDIKISSNIPKIDTISYDLKSISKEFGDCGETPANCTSAKVQYISLKNAKTNLAYLAINATLIDEIKRNAPDLTTFLDSFIKDGKSFHEEVQRSAAEYAMEIEQAVVFNSPQIITIESFNYFYTGGAHGNYGTGFYNFDVKTGEEIDLKKLLVDNYEPALKNIAEQIFKKKYLEEGMTKFSEAGFYFNNDVFTLTDNFGVIKEGLKFVYTPYEVGPYSLGQQEIVIPFTALKALIRKDGLLANL